MRVTVVGGGPAGLCFAMLLKQRRPSDEITVFERGRPDDTYGWGITLPRRTLEEFEPLDATVAHAIAQRSVGWDQIHILHRGRRVEIAGTPLLGIARLTLLNVLQARCRDLDVCLRFDAPVDRLSMSSCDLLVLADGATSALRRSLARDLGSSTRLGLNRYTWLGTPHVFAGLSVSVVQAPHGVFVGHGYPFSQEASTFVVECREEAWRSAGLDEKSSTETCEYLAGMFAESLRGHPLLFRRAVRWATFMHVKSERWHHDRMVLIGDAAHAIHFSVGSGTMLAIGDASALAVSLDQHTDVRLALDAFEKRRQPVVAAFQSLEATAVGRLERMHEFMTLEPLDLAYLLLSR